MCLVCLVLFSIFSVVVICALVSANDSSYADLSVPKAPSRKVPQVNVVRSWQRFKVRLRFEFSISFAIITRDRDTIA